MTDDRASWRVVRPLAVVSDGSKFHRDPGATVLSSLMEFAALLHEHAGIATTAALVTAEDDQQLIDELRRLTANVNGVYLTHTNTERAQAAQAALAGQLAIITELQW